MLTPLVAYQKDYRYGAAALLNSLAAQGFRGRVIFATDSLQEYDHMVQQQARGAGIDVIFTVRSGVNHFAFVKPTLAAELLSTSAPHERVVYFDPDIVLVAPFEFIDRWSQYGIALVEELQFYRMHDRHPVRLEWIDWLAARGRVIQRTLGMYFNSGFFTASSSAISWLRDWAWILAELEVEGQTGPGVDRSRHRPFATWDQDAMNASLMLEDLPVSPMGPDAMGFTDTAIVLLHATGPEKPWRKRFIHSALQGRPPTLADRGWLGNCRGPISVLPVAEYRKRVTEMRIATAIGRLVRRA